MRTVSIGNVSLLLESAEAGTRYHAPILIVPGLFHSQACWHGMMSMLAHRGWDVYLLPRQDRDGASTADELDWQGAVDGVARAAGGLGDKVIVFGADIGASMALSVSDAVRPLALGLFAPTEPATLMASFDRSLGFFGRRRVRRSRGDVTAPPALAKKASHKADVAPEPRAFVEDLMRGVPFEPPGTHPPAIVFPPDDDPLVERTHALRFAENEYAKPSATAIGGRWWPSSRWESAADAVHRFLILTLSDRVVEFPDEIIND